MKIKQIFLTLAFVLAALFTNAQTKYEYMVIQYNTHFSLLSVSINGDAHDQEIIEMQKAEKTSNANPFLKKVKEFQDKGWEVMNFTNATAGTIGNTYYNAYFGYLRKKIAG